MTREEIIADERYHTCGRCKWENIPFICHQCKWGEDVRKDLWQLKEDAEKNCNTCGQKCAIKYHGCSNWIPSKDGKRG